MLMRHAGLRNCYMHKPYMRMMLRERLHHRNSGLNLQIPVKVKLIQSILQLDPC